MNIPRDFYIKYVGMDVKKRQTEEPPSKTGIPPFL